MTDLLQLTPTIAPLADGVTFAAVAIDAYAASKIGWRSAIRVPGGDPSTQQPDLPGVVETIQSQAPDLVLLHYVNYGYESHGCPDWLIEGMERWRRESSRAVLCTYFHEVFATAPPWRRTFWLSRKQKELAARLAAISDRCITSLPLYAELLRKLGTTAPVEVRPIVSSVGEIEHPAAFETREPSMAIFGSAGVRSRAYGEHREQLSLACDELEVQAILDIGPDAQAPREVAGRPVQVLGRLPSERVSSILSATQSGFLGYPLDFLEKSSVFAAYCAHGVLPVCAGKRRRRTSAPTAGEQFWPAVRGESIHEPARIASAASTWYQEHSLARLCALLDSYLQTA